jgi:ubiquinone/menaquinone biosynthesis C-methylase UbiE
MIDARARANRDLFDTWAPTYDATVREAFGHMAGIAYDDFLARIAEVLAPPPGARVLELAVGTAALTTVVARRWTEVIHILGVDANPRMLEVARANVEARGLGATVTLQEADAATLPFEDASFDAAVASNALHHMDVPAVLSTLARVLRPGGRLVIGDYLEPARWRSLLGRLVVPPYRFSKRFSSDPAQRADNGYATILPWTRWAALLEERGLTVEHHADFPASAASQWEPVPFLVSAVRSV